MIAISLERMSSISCVCSGMRSRPCQRIWPPTNLPGGIAMSLSTERAVTVLPQPDSPTTQTVSPREIEMLTPSTARTMPSSVLKCVSRPRISSKGWSIRSPRSAGSLTLLSLTLLMHGLQLVAVRIDHEGGVVAGTIVGTQAWWAGVSAAGAECRGVEGVDGSRARRIEGEMKTSAGRAHLAGPREERELV